jgi:hypothetical protein
MVARMKAEAGRECTEKVDDQKKTTLFSSSLSKFSLLIAERLEM